MAHESFLTTRSEFFRRAMNGNWTESDTRLFKLPEDDPKTFALYLNYAYTGQLSTTRRSAEEVGSLELHTFDRYIECEYRSLLQLYVLAEKLQDVLAKNDILIAVVDVSQMRSAEMMSAVPGLKIASILYEGTPYTSPARRLVTDLCSMLPVATIFHCLQFRNIHNDLVEDLAENVQKMRPLKRTHMAYATKSNAAEAYMEKV
jgi:hypothetical protein